MSGAGFSRRDFIRMGGILSMAPLFYHCSGSLKGKMTVRITGANASAGHLLRGHEFPVPSGTVRVGTLIVGGGVSGLSAGRWLKNHGENDFLILELDEKAGGNSKGGENKVTEYPYGAHYLPLPNNDFKDLIDFLHEHKIITGFNGSGLPVYDPFYLCHTPQERLNYKGAWHADMPPKEGLDQDVRNELARFFAFTAEMKQRIGKDGKRAFTIPLEHSSTDEAFMQYDKMSVFEFLAHHGYTSDFMHWYLDYCCRDDFGSGIQQTSAWAALHYFSSRIGVADNAASHELLTWPEGNFFLVKKLLQDVPGHVHTGLIVYDVTQDHDLVKCLVYDVKAHTSQVYACKNLILATPQYVNKKLLKDLLTIDVSGFQYFPWLVANLTLNDRMALQGDSGISWDNVMYESPSLGYVNACHQHLKQEHGGIVITYYYNFSGRQAREARQELYTMKEDDWKRLIIDDLKKAHPDIESHILDIDVCVWGHGMINPQVGFRSSEARNVLDQGIGNIYFAHSDVSGISIFEQAFYRGTLAAKRILEKKA
jgi:hypothetical protein